jgi:hypothetical protein
MRAASALSSIRKLSRGRQAAHRVPTYCETWYAVLTFGLEGSRVHLLTDIFSARPGARLLRLKQIGISSQAPCSDGILPRPISYRRGKAE